MKNLIQTIFLLVILICVLCINTSYAEDKEEEKKIIVEKTEILGVLERPAVIFPVRWKYPEGLMPGTLHSGRSFKKEILEFIDLETINEEGLWE